MIVHLWETENVFIQFKREFWQLLLKIIKKNKLSWNSIYRKTGLKKSTIQHYRSNKRYADVKILLKLFRVFKNLDSTFDLNNIESIYIEKFKYGHLGRIIESPKLPFNLLNLNWARIIGALLTDGCIQNNYKTYFISKRKVLIKKVIKNCQEVLGNFKFRISKKYKGDKHWFVVILPKIVGYVLSKFAKIKRGNKIMSNVSFPRFVLNLSLKDQFSKRYICEMLSWVFSCDGYVSVSNYSIGINFNRDITKINRKSWGSFKYAPALLKNVLSYAKRLGFSTNGPYFIQTKKRKDGGYSVKWRFEISGKKSLQKFKDEIGFVIPQKTRKVDRILGR